MTAKRKNYVCISWMLVLAVMIFIFTMSAANASDSSEMSNSLLLKITELTGIEISSYFVRKAAHFSEFALLSFLLTNAIFATFQNKKAGVFAFPCACLYAVTDELHQLFSDGRACSVKDMLIDSAGALLGAVIFSFIILIYIKYSKRNTERKKDNGSFKTV
ncbi:MAG: VanZ family protein [Oscillospiraceae bacterium]|nr:VanZ family protein [Oscillospiraceae bacterium]